MTGASTYTPPITPPGAVRCVTGRGCPAGELRPGAGVPGSGVPDGSGCGPLPTTASVTGVTAQTTRYPKAPLSLPRLARPGLAANPRRSPGGHAAGRSLARIVPSGEIRASTFRAFRHPFTDPADTPRVVARPRAAASRPLASRSRTWVLVVPGGARPA